MKENLWKILNKEVTIKEAAHILNVENIPTDEDIKRYWDLLTLSYSIAAYEKLVECGEINKDEIFNLGSKGEPRPWDIGVMGGKVFHFKNGSWVQ